MSGAEKVRDYPQIAGRVNNRQDIALPARVILRNPANFGVGMALALRIAEFSEGRGTSHAYADLDRAHPPL